MSDKNTLKTSKRKKRTKRKGISPLSSEEVTVECPLCIGQSSTERDLCKHTAVNKRFYTGVDIGSTPIYVNNPGGFNAYSFDPNMNNMNNMNSSPQSMYGYMMTPQMNPQTQLMFNTPQTTAGSAGARGSTVDTESAPPAWAKQMIDDMRILKESSQNVEKTVSLISLKVTDMEEKLKSLENTVKENETTCSFLSQKYEQQNQNISSAKSHIDDMQKQLHKMKSTNEKLEKRCYETEDTVTYLQARSMRENLIFYNIPESSTVDNPENCQELVKDVIKNVMKIGTDEMAFKNAHRMGPQTARKTRPIVVRFSDMADRESVRKASYDEDVKQQLKNANRGVGVQKPQTTRDARRAFEDVVKEQESRRNSVRQQGCKLYVNGKLFKVYADGNVIDPPLYMTSTTRR